MKFIRDQKLAERGEVIDVHASLGLSFSLWLDIKKDAK
jgi:hypothetical protein